MLFVFAYKQGKSAYDLAVRFHYALDSKVQAEKYLIEKGATAKRVAVATELHWFIPASQSSGFQPHQVSALRLLRHPEQAKEWDLIVLPLEFVVRYKLSHYKAEKLPPLLELYNSAISELKPLKTFGERVVSFDCTTIRPRIGVFDSRTVAEAFKKANRRDAQRIFAAELLDSPEQGAGHTWEGGIAVFNWWQGWTYLRLQSPVAKVCVSGRNYGNYPAPQVPSVTVDVYSSDTLAKTVSVELYRGYAETSATLAPGTYKISVRAKNPDARFLTELFYLEFK